MTDEIIQQIAAVTYELYQSARDNGREVEILERQLKTLNGKIRNLTNAIADGLYNAAIKDKMDAMERERMQLLSAIDTAKNQMPDLQPEHFVYFLKRCASLTADDDTAAKKKLLQMFVKEVVLYPDRVDIVVYTLQKENTPQRLDTVECTHNVLLGGGEEN
jgi:hypothetical protein